jgi:hypothetical protein
MWDYESSLKPLTQYVNSQIISEYQRTIGQVNLTAALVYERNHNEVSKLLISLLERTKKEKQLLLREKGGKGGKRCPSTSRPKR